MKKKLLKLAAALLIGLGMLSAARISAKAAPLTMPDGTVFDPVYYGERYADLKAAFGEDVNKLWNHYRTYGRSENRVCVDPANAAPQGKIEIMDGAVWFDYEFYANRYADLKQVFGMDKAKLYRHYMTYGMKEKRQGYAGQKDSQMEQAKALERATDARYPYYVKVNRVANVVTVYAMDTAGKYSIPYKAFACSTGQTTPLGTFKTQSKVRWLFLVHNQWGQYTTQFKGPYWFHSVPYTHKAEDTLKYEEFNKLGTMCSAGCVRMTVADVKWLYDNLPVGTTIEIYDDAANPGALGSPAPARIDVNSPNRNWDPTDPNPANPWNN